MKKLLAFLFVIIILSSCATQVTRVSYIDQPLSYKDYKSSGEYYVENGYMYFKTSKGSLMKVDLDKYNVTTSVNYTSTKK